MKTNPMDKSDLEIIGNEDVKAAEYFLRTKDLKGNPTDHSVDSTTYWCYTEKIGGVQGKTVVFKNSEGKRVRGIFDTVACKLYFKEN